MRRIVATLATLVVLAAGCADEQAAQSTTTTTTTTTSTTTTTTTTTTTVPSEPTDEEEIVALVELYWETVAQAFNPPDGDPSWWDGIASEELTETLVERALFDIVEGVGVRPMEPESIRVVGHSSVRVESDLAVVTICLEDRAELFDFDSGITLEAAEVFSTFEMTLAGGGVVGWLVDGASRIENFEQEAACIDSVVS